MSWDFYDAVSTGARQILSINKRREPSFKNHLAFILTHHKSREKTCYWFPILVLLSYGYQLPLCHSSLLRRTNCFIGSLGAVLVQHLDASTTLRELPHDGLHLVFFPRIQTEKSLGVFVGFKRSFLMESFKEELCKHPKKHGELFFYGK